MKKMLLAAAMSCIVVLSAGCTQSTILDPEVKAQPDFSIVTDVELDWNQVSGDLMGYYEDSEEYPGLLTFNFSHKDEEKKIIAQLFVDVEEVDGEKAAQYAATLIKNLNDCIAIQNNSLALADESHYGGFFDDYSFTVQVMPEDGLEDESTWLVNMTVPAGEHSPVIPLGGNE